MSALEGYQPHGWVIVSRDGLRKVFASWSGSYMSSEHWRLSSSIKLAEDEDHTIKVTTSSGAVYLLSKDCHGEINSYNRSILNKFVSRKDFKVEEELPSHVIT